jgi:hypothetical protein
MHTSVFSLFLASHPGMLQSIDSTIVQNTVINTVVSNLYVNPVMKFIYLYKTHSMKHSNNEPPPSSSAIGKHVGM